MSIAVFCIATNEFQAETIVTELKGAGLADNDISVLFPDKTGTQDFGHERRTKAPEAALTGAGMLGVVGGALGWMASMGILSVPAAAPLIAAGPVVAALAGLATGAVLGAIVGACLGIYIPEYVAKRYAGKMEAGNILISVHAANSRRALAVKNIFKEAGAQDIAASCEAEVPARRSSLARQELHSLT